MNDIGEHESKNIVLCGLSEMGTIENERSSTLKTNHF
jgi:hypothetical protein